ncbi:MAG TPA: hypothetical protein VF773_18800 [Verrucomicrobiae bacterium]
MLCAVQDQLTSPETPEVRTNYERLRSLGHSDAEGRELIATILASYIWHTMRKDNYSYSDYLADLAKLPAIDWHQEKADR